MHAGATLSFEAIPVTAVTGCPLAVELRPAPDPWDIVRRVAYLPHLLFLDSAEKHADRGRYSYIAADGVLHTAPRRGRTQGDSSLLADVLGTGTLQSLEGVPPFQGGLAGMFGYELGRSFESIPPTCYDEFQSPNWAVACYDWVISFDHTLGRCWLVSTGWNAEGGCDPARARSRLAGVLALLRRPVHSRGSRQTSDERNGSLAASATGTVQCSPHAPRADSSRGARRVHWRPVREKEPPEHPVVSPVTPARHYPLTGFPGVFSNFTREDYEAAVARVVDYIHAGDCFQVNLSQRLLAPLREDPLELYGRLRSLNPAPFAGYFDLGDFQILSASPERFLHLSRGEVVTRPIKGTRPRSDNPRDDAALVRDLTTNPKDRAENIMIVDLLRNDLGKVCEYGTVRVPRVCEVESFRHVHHLVSEVRGRLRPGLVFFDLLAATFPGGSVTGAPRYGRWRSSRNWSRRCADRIAAAWAGSASMARPIQTS